jgi:hypothetical protein
MTRKLEFIRSQGNHTFRKFLFHELPQYRGTFLRINDKKKAGMSRCSIPALQ